MTFMYLDISFHQFQINVFIMFYPNCFSQSIYITKLPDIRMLMPFLCLGYVTTRLLSNTLGLTGCDKFIKTKEVIRKILLKHNLSVLNSSHVVPPSSKNTVRNKIGIDYVNFRQGLTLGIAWAICSPITRNTTPFPQTNRGLK